MNYFNDDLEYSNSDRFFWNRFYGLAFPEHIDLKLVKSMKKQRLGIDVELFFPNKDVISIEEKLRKSSYGDILFEYISNDKSKTVGWMEKDLLCDYLAYGISSDKIVYLMEWDSLKKTWDNNKRKWVKKYPKVVARNPDYNTISVAVPIDEVKKNVKMWKYLVG